MSIAKDFAFEEISNEASHVGYSAKKNSDNIILTADSNKGNMPVLKCNYEANSEYFWYNVDMEFPKTISDIEYADSYEYYMNLWLDAAKLATYIQKSDYSLDDDAYAM